MAIDKNTKSMLSPTGDGGNFGISNDFSYINPGSQVQNYNECVRSVGNSTNIDKMLSKVTQTNSSGQENFNLKNLGQPYNVVSNK